MHAKQTADRLWLGLAFVSIVGLPYCLLADVESYRSTVLAEPSILSFYPADGDLGSTLTDRVAPAQNGTLSGATFSSAAGTVGAQSFQGARVALGPVPDYEFSDGSGTVEMFLYQTATAAYNPCFFAGRDDSASPAVRYSMHGGANGAQLWIWNGAAALSVATPVSMLNNLVHVAYVYNAGTLTVYFNGAPLVTWSIALGSGTGRPFQIGASGPGNQEAWQGRIDEVAIYRDALSADTIAAHYAAWLSRPGPPVIESEPADATCYVGQPLTLSVTASGSLPLSYQWFRNGAPLLHATNRSLAFTALDSTNSGFYVVTVTNLLGTASSTGATLTVVPVVIVTPPADAARFVGQSVTFTVAAAGLGPLAYQWLKDASPIDGATNAALTITQLDAAQAGAFSVRVSNVYGATNSPAAVLRVVDPNTPLEVGAPPPFEWLPQDNGVPADAVVLFNEIMYHPGPGSTSALQWIELHNVLRVDVDISSWQLDGGAHFTFPSNTIVSGGGFVVVAGDLAAFTQATGLTNVFGPFYTNLANNGERLILRNHDGRMMDELTYGDEPPWPEGADGSGATLSKRVPLSASAEPRNWIASAALGGTPGRANVPSESAAPSLRPLLAFYDFDGNAQDTSGNNLHGTAANATLTSGSGGYEGECYLFAGTDSYVGAPVDISPDTFAQVTIGAWVDVASLASPARHCILSADDGGYDRGLTVDTRNGGTETGVARYSAFGGISTGVIPGSPANASDSWVFLAAVYDQFTGSTTFYVNDQVFSGGATHGSSLHLIHIGNNPTYGENFAGKIDNVFVFRRALSAAQIAAIRAGGASAIRALGDQLWQEEQSGAPAFVEAPRLAFNELDAATNGLFRVELQNHGAVPLDLAAFSLVTTSTNGATRFPLPALALDPGQFVVFDAPQTGFRPAQDDKLFLLTSNATVLVDAATAKNQLRGRAPDGNGRWLRPTAPSFGSSNVVVINRDVVINEILYEAAPSYPSNRYVAAEEEWVELYNRGANPVNLAGWSLDSGVRFDFPSNTVLAPAGYLVVARDAAAVQAAHPGVTVLGNYSGRLARPTDLVELKDANRTVVSEVRYHTGGRWPAYAAGGGSSLELVDPYADHRRAESWQASDETARGAWQTIAYRGLATNNPGYAVGYTIWNEFVFGLLDAGECLLDDVSVIELPGTAQARQLVQNGSFESDPLGATPAAWRAIGTHGLHGRTVVETDPANPGNKVLHVVASGATDFLHNHLTTTLKSGGTVVSVVAGREYEISFRARWLGGARLVNSRLYPKWLARTSVLDAPAAGGTPGAINSRRVVSAGPTYRELAHAPAVPPAGSNITVTVQAYDPQGVVALTLWWRPDGGSWSSTPMAPDAQASAPGGYRAIIPGQSAGAKVQFYVQGRDRLGSTSFFPAGGPEARALVMVDDGLAAAPPMPNLRFILTAADTARLYSDTNRMSNDRLGATVIYNESEIFYDVGVRLKGSAYGRTHDTETGLSIDFDPDHKFRGAHDSISIERSGTKREILAKHLFTQAGRGVAAGYDDVAQILTPRPGDVGRGLLAMTRTTDTFLDTQYGPGGTVYNFELLYTPTTTVNGNPEAPKLNFPYSHVSGEPDLQDLGDDEEFYRWNFQLRNNRTRDDFALMIAAAKSFELNGAAMDARMRQVLDVDQWLRCFATESLVGNDDIYTRLWNHNLRFYQRPADNRLVAMPWDLDRAFNLSTSASLWGSGPNNAGNTNRLRKLIEYPANLRTYYAHLLDLIGTCYNAEYATRWANHYAALTGDGGISGYATYIANRGAYVRGQIPAQPAFNITTSNGLSFAANSNLVTLAGTAPYAVRWIRVNGVLFEPAWSSVTAWSLPLALAAGTNALTLEGFDAQGNPLAGATDAIGVTVNVPVDDPQGRVVVNEIVYQPRVPEAEFIELYNTSTTTAFDLAGWHLNGTGLTFSNGTVVPPGGFLVLAANRAAFAGAYGAAVPVAAEFPGRLDLDGETLSLLKPDGTNAPVVVDRVRYEAAAPWPVGASGTGLSLQLIDASVDNARVSAWSDGSGWRFASLTGTLQTNSTNIALWLNTRGDVFIDDLSLVAGSAPGAGENLLRNGDFESPLASVWFFTGTGHSGSALSTAYARSGSASLHLVATNNGSVNNGLRQAITPPASNGTYTLSCWFLPSPNGTNFTLRSLSGSLLTLVANFRPVTSTPGTTNSTAAVLPPYPPLWLNEAQPRNVTGPAHSLGQREPWVELFNAGSDALRLEGFTLADNYTNLAQWSFPSNAAIPAGQFLVVWADGRPELTTDSEFHTSFRLALTNGSVALARSVSGALQLVDYLNYPEVAADGSYGSVPDGQPFYRHPLYYATPGAANDDRSAPLVVFINEWLAANTSDSGFADPADGDFEDWFELYNPGPNAVDLGGCFLTDNLTNKFQFEIPRNGHYVLPPGGYLLVWADSETGQNSTNRTDLHVSFNLRAAGEAIGLFAADGTRIDAVTFGPQSANVSQGRSPDGSDQIVSMPHPSPRQANEIVTARPAVTDITVSGATVTLTFTTQPGLSYRVQFKDDLGAAVWSDLPGDVTATGSTASKSDEHNGVQRFYRVMIVP